MSSAALSLSAPDVYDFGSKREGKLQTALQQSSIRNGDVEELDEHETHTNGFEDGTDFHKRIQLRNKNIHGLKHDIMYHIALGTNSHDLEAMFGDVKFVCLGGSPRRMEAIAGFMVRQLGFQIPAGQALVNIAAATDRYAIYKIGPILTVSHGIGISSFSVVMHELIKLLYHAKATNVCMFRLGTSGGIGLKPGSVVVSKEALDPLFRPFHEMHILGKVVKRPAVLDQQLVDDILSCSRADDQFDVIAAKTLCTNDFYEGQGRLDGAFCDYTEQDKLAYLQRAHENGVRNIEMESLCFASMCQKAGIRGAVVCVTLLDRLLQDQVTEARSTLKMWEERPASIVSRYIRSCLDCDTKLQQQQQQPQQQPHLSNGFGADRANNYVTFMSS